MGYHAAMGETTARPAAHADHFRHSYSKDRAQLIRRLSRVEGQVRGIARMIERDEYCVDILQQTAALRAAVDAISILILEDHVQGCVRTAAERGEADKYVDEVIDVVRRTLGRPVRGSSALGLTGGSRRAAGRLAAGASKPPVIHGIGAARAFGGQLPLTRRGAGFYRPQSATGMSAARGAVREGPRGDPGRNRPDDARPPERPPRRTTTPGAAPGRSWHSTTGGCPGPAERSAPDARFGPRAPAGRL